MRRRRLSALENELGEEEAEHVNRRPVFEPRRRHRDELQREDADLSRRIEVPSLPSHLTLLSTPLNSPPCAVQAMTDETNKAEEAQMVLVKSLETVKGEVAELTATSQSLDRRIVRNPEKLRQQIKGGKLG